MLRFRPFLFCLAIAATVAAALWPILGGEYTYDQFVVGAISWRAENKSVDYQALAVVVIVFLALAVALSKAFGRDEFAPSASGTAMEELAGLALLPLALWLGAAMTRNVPPGFPCAFAVAAGVILLYGGWLRLQARSFDSEAACALGGTLLCSFLLAFFAGLALLLLAFHASGHRAIADTATACGIAIAAMGINALVVGALLARMRVDALPHRALNRWIIALQFPLPPLGLVLLPAFLTYRGAPEPYVWPWKLVLALAACAALTWLRLARRWRDSDVTSGPLSGALEPLALAMIAVFLTCPRAAFELLAAPGYPTLFGDDFHMGEQILPWQQWFDFHRLPYIDFAPVHGLMPLATGALDQFFFDGTLAHLDSAFAVLVAISCVTTIGLASRVAGAGTALALCFLLAPFDRLLFLAPALLLLADPALLRRPVAWLAAWLATSVFMIAYNAAVGSAFAGGTAVCALFTLYRASRMGKPALRALAIVAVVAVAVVGVTPHLAAMLAGLFEFIAENGATNTVGHGVALARGFGLPGNPADGVFASRMLFDLLCLAWIVVALHALQRSIAGWNANRRGALAEGVTMLPLATGLTLILLAAWSIGRIDVEYASRTGAVSFLAVGTLLPVIVLARGRHRASEAVLAYALIVGLYAGMYGLADRFSPAQLVARATPRVEIPASLVRAGDADFGGSRVGTLFVRPERHAEIVAFRQAIDAVVPPGQTWFDLTNRQANYFYLDRPVPALYAATFNTLNARQQRRVLDQLARSPPVAVSVAPALDGDTIKASLRSFFLYRHFLRGYRPVAVGPYTFLVNAESPAFASAADPSRDATLLDTVFAHPNLQMLPATWGRSWPSLKSAARPLGEFALAPANAAESACPVTAGAASVSLGRYNFRPAREAGLPADLVEIRLSEGVQPPATLTLAYRSVPTGIRQSMTMQVRGNTLIVPVASYPSWLLGTTTPSIELCAPAGAALPANLIAGIAAWSIPNP